MKYELKDMQVRLCLKETGAVYLSRPALTSPDAVREYLVERLRDSSREEAVILCLDARNKPLNLCTIGLGGMESCVVSVAEVFKAALISNATKIIFAHNHPSGNVAPSGIDRDFTENLVKAGQLLGLPVIDHVIVGSITGSCYSFFEQQPEMFS